MRKVLILMSSYNGEKCIERQIKSIIEQKDVDINLLIRDDGSTDDTVKILDNIAQMYGNKVQYYIGKNIGWKRSFMDLLFAAGEFDYYGFADQDDVWFKDKIITLIKLMETDGSTGIKLAQCASLAVDSNFQVLEEQEYKEIPKSFKSIISMDFFQGCSMLWNKAAMKKIQKYIPGNINLAHDFWVGIVCYYFGKVYFTKERKVYHIRYYNNASTDGSVFKGRIKKLKSFILNQDVYSNPANDLLLGYKNELPLEFKEFLKDLINYKSSIKSKYRLVIDKEFRRKDILPSIFFKMMILINRF